MIRFLTILFLALAFGLAPTTPCAAQDLGLSGAHKSSGWKTLNTGLCSMQYPTDWEVDESGQYGTKFFIFSPLSSDKDEFRDNIGMVTEDLGNNTMSLSEYIDLSKKNLSKFITNAEVLETRKVAQGSATYYRIIYTGEQGNYHLKFDAAIWIKNNTAYVLTFVTLENEYPQYATTVNKMMGSFSLK